MSCPGWAGSGTLSHGWQQFLVPLLHFVSLLCWAHALQNPTTASPSWLAAEEASKASKAAALPVWYLTEAWAHGLLLHCLPPQHAAPLTFTLLLPLLVPLTESIPASLPCSAGENARSPWAAGLPGDSGCGRQPPRPHWLEKPLKSGEVLSARSAPASLCRPEAISSS